jgi:hypothetical protein
MQDRQHVHGRIVDQQTAASSTADSDDLPDAPGNAVVPVTQVEPPATLRARFGEQARAYRDAGRSAGTRRVYESAFSLFKAWCANQGRARCRPIRAPSPAI